MSDGAGVSRPGYLYRHWSTTGSLLYIGISLNAVARLAQHKDKTWFPRIAEITVQRFETYAEAEIAELKAICYEGPIHNIKGPRDAKDLGPALTSLRARQKRLGSGGDKRATRLREDFEVDVRYRCVPDGLTFGEYAERAAEWKRFSAKVAVKDLRGAEWRETLHGFWKPSAKARRL